MESSSGVEEPVNFGRSIIVPSVQELVKESILKIPPRYARPEQEPVTASEDGSVSSVPIVDLERLEVDDSVGSELHRLHAACKDWGFFQVVNHKVSNTLLENFRMEVENFFKLPFEEKQQLWQQPDNHEGFGQLFVISEEQKLDWCDMFFITTLPTDLRRKELFDKLPPNLRCTLEAYCTEMRKLAMRILDYMAKALKMEAHEMKDLFSDGVQTVRMNYYPTCPQPDKAIGLTPHSDADALTILFQLNETEGLQIRKEERWIPVRVLPNAFVVNVGDMMEIFSNGIYRSIEHRAIVNSAKERLSVATFHSPKLSTLLGPAPSIIDSDNPAVFRQMPLEKYFKEFFSRKLNGKSYVDFMRITDDDKVL
ncbi:hypothetical protein K2173_001385 [Erythroxylum novogranatense]|uniref:Fe2OG dioxygenase domain-containing protein n=1 Tax=Erythroxylum novogranatense TaxID=1862640 RepID=A0AAV8T4M9_9ROSI|nr:hypothetical protein K2173_001385 [Erythroxylum novogranatense]